MTYTGNSYQLIIIQQFSVCVKTVSWLPHHGLDGWKVCSQVHISLITNSFF